MSPSNPRKPAAEPARLDASARRRQLVFGWILASSVALAAGYAAHVVWRSKAAAAAAEPIASIPMTSLPGPSTGSAPVIAPDTAASVPLPRSASPQVSPDSPTSAPAVAPALAPVISRASSTANPALPARAAAGEPSPAAPAASGAAARVYLLFRSTALGDSYGRVSLAYLDAPDEPRSVSALACDRVHFSAGAGVCLEALRSGIASYRAHVFDASFTVRHTVPLGGPPSRTRVSRDGRLAAFTVFLTGHSYATPGFTTRTSVIDTASGRLVVEDLEAFSVLKDGAPFKSADFNFWGFTFSRDVNRFYATLGTEGKVYLVEGDLSARQMRVIHDDVECPSLSPDDSQVAFKRRSAMDPAGRRIWRLVVLNLSTRQETLLDAETRNVDDQVEWLNNREILYAMPKSDQQSSAGTDIWAIPADAAGPPRLLLPFAFSPAAVR
jgi:hypothetical protein